MSDTLPDNVIEDTTTSFSEESLNTSESNENTTEETSPPSPKQINGNHTNGVADDHVVGVKTTPERPQNLKSDEFIQDAGLSRTGNVPRKSSMERLLGKTSESTRQRPKGR